MNCPNCGGSYKEKNGQLVCVFCGSIYSQESASAAFVNYRKNNGSFVFEKNINGVLEITCIGQKNAWSGSGYLISLRGYAITNAHVAADYDGSPCKLITASICGNPVRAQVIALADDNAGNGNGLDLAIIKLESVPFGATALSFANNASVKNGEEVFVIGNALGEGNCITSGIISDKNRTWDGKNFIMTDCAVNGGNSGGPLFDCNGQVLGTITLQGRTNTGSDAEGMNYAIPANDVKEFIDMVCKNRSIIL